MQVLVLWDAFLSQSWALVDYVCVAMLINIREELLDQMPLMASVLLLRYPPCDIHDVLSCARELMAKGADEYEDVDHPKLDSLDDRRESGSFSASVMCLPSLFFPVHMPTRKEDIPSMYVTSTHGVHVLCDSGAFFPQI